MSTKAKLEQARKDKEVAILAANKEIARLEEQLEKESRPKLRHGDYGKWLRGEENYFLVDKSGSKEMTYLLWKESTKLGYTMRNSWKNDYKVFVRNTTNIDGNIFDDLKEMHKPLKEFDVDCSDFCGGSMNVSFNGDKESSGVHLSMEQDGKECFMSVKFNDLIMNLRRMQTTIRKEQHENK